MRTDVFRFTFDPAVDMLEVEATLQLAIVAAEGLFGEARTRMDAAYFVDAPRATMLVDGNTAVGNAVIRIFTTFATHEFGADAFSIRRVTTAHDRGKSAPASPVEAAA